VAFATKGSERFVADRRPALSRALGDPDLQVALATKGSERFVAEWVDEAGRPVVVDRGAERAVTFVEDGGVPVAALLHDPAALRDPALAGPVAAAARLAVATARLQAEVAERVREVAASRQRLVEAGDEERRRLGDAMRAGPAARLAGAHARLRALAPVRDGAAGELLAQLDAELDRAVEDLARFARGLHPRTLTEGGLAAALGELTDAPLRVEADVARREPAQAAALYFACSEALANVAKHAPGALRCLRRARRLRPAQPGRRRLALRHHAPPARAHARLRRR
jgi:signal transduction histidine kinase